MNRFQSGFGMLEILIAMTLIAFGLLGMAGLQASSLRYQKTAHFRSIASIAMSDMAERIRANTQAAHDGKYMASADSMSAGTVPTCSGAGTCSSNQIAAFDVATWLQELSRNLPEGRGEISGDIKTGMKISVCYKDPGYAENSKELGGVHCFSTNVLP